MSTEALERVLARVASRAQTAAPPPAAPPVNPPPAPPTAPPAGTADITARLDDLEAAVGDLQGQVAELESTQVESALSDLDSWGEPGMMAALPATPFYWDVPGYYSGHPAFRAATAADSSTSLTAQARKQDAQEGVALPDGSFPIRSQADVTNAVTNLGHPGVDTGAAKAHILKRVRALGLTDWAHEHAPSLYPAAA